MLVRTGLNLKVSTKAEEKNIEAYMSCFSAHHWTFSKRGTCTIYSEPRCPSIIVSNSIQGRQSVHLRVYRLTMRLYRYSRPEMKARTLKSLSRFLGAKNEVLFRFFFVLLPLLSSWTSLQHWVSWLYLWLATLLCLFLSEWCCPAERV